MIICFIYSPTYAWTLFRIWVQVLYRFLKGSEIEDPSRRMLNLLLRLSGPTSSSKTVYWRSIGRTSSGDVDPVDSDAVGVAVTFSEQAFDDEWKYGGCSYGL